MLSKSLDLLTSSEKWRLVVLLIAIFVVGLLQMMGVGSIVPLLGLLADPNSIQSHSVSDFVRDFYDFSSADSIVIFLAGLAFGIIVISNGLTAVTFWFMFRFVWSIQSRLSTELLARYMSHPYEVLLGKNPAEAEKNILVGLAKNQTDLQLVLEQLAENNQNSGNSLDELTQANIRNIEIYVSRLLEELSSGRDDLIKQVRSEIKLLARTIAASLKNPK